MIKLMKPSVRNGIGMKARRKMARMIRKNLGRLVMYMDWIFTDILRKERL